MWAWCGSAAVAGGGGVPAANGTHRTSQHASHSPRQRRTDDHRCRLPPLRQVLLHLVLLIVIVLFAQ